MLIGGIDEANKGQCLNSIVVVCVYTQKKRYIEVPYLGDSKSKKYTGRQLKEILKKYGLRYKTLQIPVRYIDRYNVNTLLLKAQAHLIKILALKEVYLDCHFQDPAKLKLEVQNLIGPIKCAIRCEHKMDGYQALTGLASLIAFHKKEINLKRLKDKLGQAVGSGNLADPLTKDYIKRHYPNVPNLRRSWDLKSIFKNNSTYNPLVKKKKG